MREASGAALAEVDEWFSIAVTANVASASSRIE